MFLMRSPPLQPCSPSRNAKITSVNLLLQRNSCWWNCWEGPKTLKALFHFSPHRLTLFEKSNRNYKLRGLRCVCCLFFQDLIVDQTIEKVSFCAPDRNYDKAFSYICRDGTTRRWMCHCFMALKDSVRLPHHGWVKIGKIYSCVGVCVYACASLNICTLLPWSVSKDWAHRHWAELQENRVQRFVCLFF